MRNKGLMAYSKKIDEIILRTHKTAKGDPNFAYLNSLRGIAEKLKSAAMGLFMLHPEDRPEHDDYLVRMGLHELGEKGFVHEDFCLEIMGLDDDDE